jgi:nucleoside-diphosphate-sugar epimerase
LKIAVTGATGLVGSNLIDYLLNKKSYQLTAILRNPANAAAMMEPWRDGGVEIVKADIHDASALDRAMSGCDVVVHAAGVVNPYGSRLEIFETNVEGTRKVLAAAKSQNVKQFVFVSSLSVITGMSDQYNVTEEAPLVKSGEAYADSKVAAEQLVMGEVGKGGMVLTAVRPGFIYGPRERSWLPRLIQSITCGKAALIDGGGKQTNVIYVDNLSRAIEATFLNAKTYGQVYNLTDDEVVTKKQLFDAIADGLDLPRVTRVVPSSIARVFCQAVSSIAGFLPSNVQPKLARYSRAAFRLAGLNQGFAIAKAKRDLSYSNCIPFQQGMSKTLASFSNKAGADKSKSLVSCQSGWKK